MKRIRVYELARQVGKSPKELLSLLKNLGLPQKSHLSVLSEEEKEKVLAHLHILPEEDEPATAPPQRETSFPSAVSPQSPFSPPPSPKQPLCHSFPTHWLALAQQGHPKAMFLYGLYHRERGDREREFQWTQRAAEAGLPEALYHLAFLQHQRGRFSEAFELLVQGAEKGDARAALTLGRLWEQGAPPLSAPDIEKALMWYQRSWEKGWKPAQEELARLLLKRGEKDKAKPHLDAILPHTPQAFLWLGLDAKERQDWQEARHYFQQAAQQNLPEGWLALGHCHALGLGGPKDILEAQKCYQKACDLGHREGQKHLHWLARQEPLEVEPKAETKSEEEVASSEATSLTSSSAPLFPEESAPSSPSEEGLYQQGLDHYLRGEREAAYELWQQAAQQGHPLAQFALSLWFLGGEGVVSLDLVEGDRWLQKALSHPQLEALLQERADTDPLAQCFLGYIHSEGVAQKGNNYREAFGWYTKAAEGGVPYASLQLGHFYAHGRGTMRNEEQALLWYRQAAEKGNALAQFALGEWYERQSRWEEAQYWFSLAAEQGDTDAEAALMRLRSTETKEFFP